jgi:hypothetical protein
VSDWVAKLDDQIVQAIKEHLRSEDDKHAFAKNEPATCQRERVLYHLNVFRLLVSSAN